MVNKKTYFLYIGLIFFLLTFFGCGGGGSHSTDSNAGAGSIGFSLGWENPVGSSMSKSTAFRAASTDICTDYGIATINAYVLDSSNSTVASGSWACSAHGGTLAAVPAGSNYTLRVEAVVSGAVKWRGEVTGISIITGQTTNLGQITMSYIGNDTTPPTVSSTSPASNATSIPVNSTVTATFSEKVAPSSLDTTTFTLSNGPNQINGTVSYDQNSMTATFAPISPLSYATTYTATLTTGVKDMAGNVMASNYTWTFTTATTPDTTPPTVSSTSPADSATGVAVNTAITATFSEAMDASTITTATFTLNNGVTGTVTYSGTTATFTPSSNLSYSTTYTATITTGVKDAAGNAMVANYSWTFTTGSALSAPTGVSATGGDGQVTISWTAVTGATAYSIYYSTASGVTKTAGNRILPIPPQTIASPYTHTGLTNGTTYYYVVTAVNSYGESVETSQVSATTQAVSSTWAKSYTIGTGTTSIDPSSIQQTNDGGYVMAGTTGGGTGYGELSVSKLNIDGAVSWWKTYGGSGWDTAASIKQTSDGGFIVAGSTNSFNAGYSDIWILKLDLSGGIVWQKTYGTSGGSEYATDIQQTKDGGYIVTGYTNYNTGSWLSVMDIIILKIDTNGGIVWQKTYDAGLNYPDVAYSIEQTSDNGYIVAGASFYQGWLDTVSNIWIIKLDINGDVLWQKRYGDGSYREDYAFSVKQTSDGGYIVGGRDVPGSCNYYGCSYNQFDIRAIKLDATGGIVWQKVYGGASSDTGSLKQTSDGSFIIAGTIDSSGAGSKDVWVLKIDSSGGIVWQKTYGSSAGEIGKHISQTSDGGYVLAGFTGQDGLVLKLDSNGNISFSGSSGFLTSDTSIIPSDSSLISSSTSITAVVQSFSQSDTAITPIDTSLTTVTLGP